jgi:hypothetical protein
LKYVEIYSRLPTKYIYSRIEIYFGFVYSCAGAGVSCGVAVSSCRTFSKTEEVLSVFVDNDKYNEVIKNKTASPAVIFAIGPPEEGVKRPLLPPPKIFASPAPLPA